MDPVIDTQLSLLDLPTELLDKICGYLTFFEMITFGDTNKHLKAVTGRILTMQTELDLTSYKFNHKVDKDGKMFLKAVGRALKMYGSQFKKLRYKMESLPANDVLPLILKYCSGGSLIDLMLGGISGQESMEVIRSIQPIYKNLKSLSLENYDLWLTDLGVILTNCQQLEKLELDISGGLTPIYRLDLEQLLRNLKKPLKELHLHLSERSWDKVVAVTNLLKIFQHHQQLHVFKMNGFVGEKIDSKILTQLLPALEVLSLRYIDNQMNYQPLLQLQHLTFSRRL